MIDRKQAPAFTSSFSLSLPSPEVTELTNGNKVFWSKDVQQEVVKLELIFKSGKWFEPQNGISFFTAQLLDKGTDQKSSKEIADLLDQFGAQIEISAGLDYTSVSLFSLTRYLNNLLPIFQEIIQNASFPENELEIAKSIQIQNLKINNEKTNYVASKLIRKNIFGNDHPYGRSIEESDVLKITREGIARFFKDIFIPHQTYITGNISNKDYQSILMMLSAFGKIGNNQVEFSPRHLEINERVNKEGSVQSSIRIGKSSIKSSHPEYFGLLTLNHILGGYFGSRLMKNIREEKGLTYGIYSSLSSFAADGLFTIGAEVNKENVNLTIEEIWKELHKLKEEPISSEELRVAKNHLMGSLQLDMANPFSVSERIKNIYLNNLPLNFYDLLLDHIEKINSADLLKIANTHLEESEFFKVVAG